MQLKVVILIGLILMSSGASALNFDEKIKVNGDGYMLTKTNTEQSSDLAEGHGTQIYHRSLSSQLGVSSLTSEYNLKGNNFRKNYNNHSFRINGEGIDNDIYVAYYLLNPAYFPNRYLISMKSPTGLRHAISVYGLSGEGAENLTSVSSIVFEPAIEPPSPIPTSSYTVSTSYNLNGNGSLSERLIDLSLSLHPPNLAETSIIGNFNVNSRLSDTLTLTAGEAQAQLAKADSVTPVSDMPQQSMSSVTVADLESMLSKGLITQDNYLIKMQELLETNRITADQYATRLTSTFDSNLITLSYADYSALMHKATSGLLNDLNAMVNRTLITPGEYLIKLGQMLDANRITEADYLRAIITTKAATNVSEIQYSAYVNKTLNEMESKFVKGMIDWPTYSGRLNAMLSFGLINQEDFDSQIQKSSNETILVLEQMLQKGLINQDDFAGKLKDMNDKGRISETQYDHELSKFKGEAEAQSANETSVSNIPLQSISSIMGTVN
jgi:hypothetical protein